MKKTVFFSTLLGAGALLLYLNCSPGPAYKYVKVADPLPEGKLENLSPEELAVEQDLKKAAAIPKAAEYFNKFFNVAYIVVEGYDKLAFTYVAAETGAEIRRGIDKNVKPDVTIRMNAENCKNLFLIFEDGVLSDEEEYRIFRVTMLASIKSALKLGDLYKPYVAKKLALPNFIQLRLKNENNYVYQNTTKELVLSMVNVDGQWLAFEGSAGKPAKEMAFDHEQAREFRTLVFKFTSEKDANREQKLKNLKTLKQFIDDVTVKKAL